MKGRDTTFSSQLWRFASQPHLRSPQDGYCMATVHKRGDFIVLRHLDVAQPVLMYIILLNHIMLELSQPVLAIIL